MTRVRRIHTRLSSAHPGMKARMARFGRSNARTLLGKGKRSARLYTIRTQGRIRTRRCAGAVCNARAVHICCAGVRASSCVFVRVCARMCVLMHGHRELWPDRQRCAGAARVLGYRICLSAPLARSGWGTVARTLSPHPPARRGVAAARRRRRGTSRREAAWARPRRRRGRPPRRAGRTRAWLVRGRRPTSPRR